MNIKVSEEYEIVIPPDILKKLGFKPGDELVVKSSDGRILIIKRSKKKVSRKEIDEVFKETEEFLNSLEDIEVPTLDELTGLAKGMSTEGLREKEDRF